MSEIGCNCGKRSSATAQKFKITGSGDPTLDGKTYDSETEAQLALRRRGKTGAITPA